MDYRNAHKAHPWHGISLGKNVPEEVRAFIEIVPTDTVKYEVDKESGYLSLDRPQKFSNIVPSLYGFLPRTYCGPKMAELTNKALVRTDVEGDGDPLDICILTEKDVTHGDIIVNARPIGGLRLLDHNQADDKIIAVLKSDAVYGSMTDIDQVPLDIIRRLIHYFSTYKDIPGEHTSRMQFVSIYGPEVAKDVALLTVASASADAVAAQLPAFSSPFPRMEANLVPIDNGDGTVTFVLRLTPKGFVMVLR
jgi:inorganic pyrophosphatase